jgi:hypothetical protein
MHRAMREMNERDDGVVLHFGNFLFFFLLPSPPFPSISV